MGERLTAAELAIFRNVAGADLPQNISLGVPDPIVTGRFHVNVTPEDADASMCGLALNGAALFEESVANIANRGR
jgi:hypothetical protein